MRDEITKVREQHRYYSIPQRTVPDEPPVTLEETTARRRSLRMTTDDLISKGLLNGDAAALLNSLCETMTATAGACAGLGVEPDVNDLLLGVKDLTEDVRVLLDKSISVREYDQLKIGATMMEIVCVGTAAILGLPYREAIAMAHAKYMNAETPSRDDFADVLRAAGIKVDEEDASNDAA